MLVIGNHAQNVESIDNSELNIIAFVDDKAKYVYYDDDGKTYDYKNGKCGEISIEIKKNENIYIINV